MSLTSQFNPLKPLYVVHGEEALLSLEAIDRIREASKEQGYLDREIYTIDQNFNWQSILDSAASMSLFSNKKLLQINIPTGKPGKEGGETLLSLAQNLPEDTVILIYLPKLERAQMQSKWFTALHKVAWVIENKEISREALPRWLKERLERHQLQIEADALALFAQRVEGNLLAAKQEVDKLALLYPPETVLKLDQVEKGIAQLARFDVFQLAETWMKGDSARLLRLLDGLAQDLDAPVLLIWAVSEDVRSLLRLKAGISQGKTIDAMAASLRLWGIKKTLAPQALKRLSVKKLLASLQTCAKIDRQIKGAEEGDVWEEVRRMLLILCA